MNSIIKNFFYTFHRTSRGENGEEEPQSTAPNQSGESAGENNGSQLDIYGGLTVEFLYVGQADCTLIYAEGGTMLIDGGNTYDGPLVVSYLKSLGIERLDYVVATHAHEDHYGGLRAVLRELEVEKVMLPKEASSEYGYGKFLEAAEASGAELLSPESMETIELGEAVFTVLSCEPVEDPGNYNESSIVLRMDYGDTSWLFEADAEAQNEEAMLTVGGLDVDVLKVGHHGSYSSSSRAFLDAVTPEICVISCGIDNEFEHPHDVTMRRLAETGAELLRTDTMGTIRIHTSGEGYEITTLQTNTDYVEPVPYP